MKDFLLYFFLSFLISADADEFCSRRSPHTRENVDASTHEHPTNDNVDASTRQSTPSSDSKLEQLEEQNAYLKRVRHVFFC